MISCKENCNLFNIRGISSSICLYVLFFTGLVFLNPAVIHAQEYGLEFVGQPELKDNRTKLDLNPEDFYSFNDEFELRFSIKLRPTIPESFGYIARIIDKEDRNIDIIYNGPGSHSLQVVCGQDITNISVSADFLRIYDGWVEIGLKIDLRKQSLSFYTADTSLIYSNIDFDRKVKILFGANNYAPSKTTDVPSMNIRDIKIFQKDKCLQHFPLDEKSGDIANDVVSRKEALVQNPIWIKPKYYDWVKSYNTKIHGFAAIGYDMKNDKVYMVGDEKMTIFSVVENNTTSLTYKTTFSGLQRGSQIFFDTIENTLFCYSLKFKTVYYFNLSSQNWELISTGTRSSTVLWFHNKYYSSLDSSLYTFGGYGQHKYSNLIQKYDFRNQQWDTLQTGGEIFHPRMHAAIGSFEDTIYILGGFGSNTGDQIQKPHHYKDLLAYSIKDKIFLDKYEFQSPLEDIDFAHSMVINKKDRSYYVLASTIFEYETYLQLLRGNLADTELEMLGNKIPYLFHNENSYSDLYFSNSSQKLIAATFLADTEKDSTEISIYSIHFPPHITEIEKSEPSHTSLKILLGFILLLIAASLFNLLIRYFRKRKKPKGRVETGAIVDNSESNLTLKQVSIRDEGGPNFANSFIFFGGFQFINRNGEDITKKFTRLLKELFLVIFLYSVKNKGISVQNLTEFLWFSMDTKSAKNNRAVNIAKLKNLLSEIDGCDLSRKTGYWRIVFNDSIVYNDYWTCLKTITQKNSLSKEELLQVLKIIKTGPLLGSANYEWLDEIKSECSNLIIDKLLNYCAQDMEENDFELMIKLADAILIFDILHEEAIGLKCRALTAIGKHNIAKDTFKRFTKEYEILYNEPYEKSFLDVINQKVEPGQ
ncbi:MAG: hypothetical protein K9H49_08530 [Bacteroidales bacterium]|nr:hypothetical protein [Bacteroidales bacterium]MCF8390444.1 hypothetical protein [Bacteroidales bacterium]